MKAFDDVCQQIALELKQLETDIAALEADLASFEKYSASYPIEQIGLRMQKVHQRIIHEKVELLIDHDNQGSVYVRNDNGKIRFLWFEKGPIVNDASKEWIKLMTTSTAEELCAFIKHLLQELHNGNWEPAVNWLNTNRFA